MYLLEIKKAISNKFFWAAVAVSIILHFISFSYEYMEISTGKMAHLAHLTYLVIDMSYVQWFKAFLVMLPFVNNFIDEWNSGQYYNVILRCGIRKYITAKLLSVAVSASLIYCIPAIVVYIAGIILCHGNVDYGSAQYSIYGDAGENMLYRLQQDGKGTVLFLIENLTRCGIYIMHGIVGAALCVYIKNKYVALVLPFFCTVFSGFLVDTVGSITGNAYVYLLHPVHTMCYMSATKLQMWMSGVPFTFGLMVVVILCNVGIFMYGVKRRRRYG